MARSTDKRLTKRSGTVYKHKRTVSRQFVELTLIANQMERDLRLLANSVEIHVVPPLCPPNVSPFDFRHAATLIERSALVTRQWLQTGGLSLPTTPMNFRHSHNDTSTS